MFSRLLIVIQEEYTEGGCGLETHYLVDASLSKGLLWRKPNPAYSFFGLGVVVNLTKTPAERVYSRKCHFDALAFDA